MKNMMEKGLKRFCESKIEFATKHGGDIEKAIDRCYGAVMFFINYCTDEWDEEIAKWWDEEMLPKMRKELDK